MSRLVCPSCHQEATYPDASPGTWITCRHCQARLKVQPVRCPHCEITAAYANTRPQLPQCCRVCERPLPGTSPNNARPPLLEAERVGPTRGGLATRVLLFLAVTVLLLLGFLIAVLVVAYWPEPADKPPVVEAMSPPDRAVTAAGDPTQQLQAKQPASEKPAVAEAAPAQPQLVRKEPVPQAEPRRALTGDQVYEELLKSVAWIVKVTKLGIRITIGIGSGVVIHEGERLLLTNDHVVNEADAFAVFFPVYENKQLVNSIDYYARHAKQLMISAEILAKDTKKDLAVVQLARLPSGIRALPLAASSAKPGQTVYSIGNSSVELNALNAKDDGFLWRFTSGTVRAVGWREMLTPTRREAYFVETQSPTNPGDSGGPVVSDRLELVAVVHSMHREQRLVSYNIDVREVREFLQTFFRSRGWQWQDAPSIMPEAPRDALALMKDLQNPDKVVQRQAVVALGELGASARPALPLLLQLLKDPDATLAHVVVQTLQKIPPVEADLPVYQAALRENHPLVRQQVAARLGRLGPQAREAVPELAALLKDKDFRVRRKVVTALREIGPAARSACSNLTEALADDDREVADQAFETLMQLGIPEAAAVAQLEALLEHPRPEVELAAATLLVRAGVVGHAVKALVTGLTNPDSSIRERVMQLVSRLGTPSLRQVAASLKPAVPALRAGLGHPDRKVIWHALQLIEGIGPVAKEALPEVSQFLTDREDAMKVAAVRALGAMGPEAKSAVPALLELLRRESDAVCLEVLGALVCIGPGVGAVGLLLDALSRDAQCHDKAVEALACIGPAVVKHLAIGLEHDKASVRLGCAKALVRLGPKGRPALRAILGQKQRERVPEVRRVLQDAAVAVQR